ncbi:LysR family transcriptional regulator [Methylibium sp.]|uniref:LysR family transcriptional regulator n=1 Tax=Methylibium sp. TaxID=2067992 RepID=UPI00386216AD
MAASTRPLDSSYTPAAGELALTQGTISRQIASLEGFIGTTMFRRIRCGVVLTPAGEAYARQVTARLDGLGLEFAVE